MPGQVLVDAAREGGAAEEELAAAVARVQVRPRPGPAQRGRLPLGRPGGAASDAGAGACEMSRVKRAAGAQAPLAQALGCRLFLEAPSGCRAVAAVQWALLRATRDAATADALAGAAVEALRASAHSSFVALMARSGPLHDA